MHYISKVKNTSFNFRGRRRHSSRSSRKTSESRSDGGMASSSTADVLNTIVAQEENRHLAKSHNDTSEGAVHCFQDEYGEI